MIVYALIALGIGAAAGIFLATRHFLRKRLPATVALLHGLGGATGFVFVLLTVVREPSFLIVRQALYLLIATVALGCVNLLFHVRKVRHRTSLIVMHALCAVSAVSTLIYANFFVPHQPATPKHPPAPLVVPDAARAVAKANEKASEQPAAQAAPKPAEKEPALAPNVLTGVQRTEANKPVTGPAPLPPILFDAASPSISLDSNAALEQTAEYLRSHPQIRLVEVQGHADARGDDVRNIMLTRARAQSVVEALVAKGVERQRLRAAGYGARCPADANCGANDAPSNCRDSDRQAADRRVALMVLVDGSATFRGELACPRGEPLIPGPDRAFQSHTR